MTTIGLIGAGAVGQTIGTLLVTAGWCDAVMVASGSGRTAASLVTDLEDMAQVTGSHVRAVHAAPDAMSGCDAIVLAAPWRGDWYGIPLRFASGTPTVCMPPLAPAESVQLQTVAAKLRTAYEQTAVRTALRGDTFR